MNRRGLVATSIRGVADQLAVKIDGAGKIDHADTLIGAMQAGDIFRAHDKGREPVNVACERSVMLGVRCGNKHERRDDGFGVDFGKGFLQ